MRPDAHCRFTFNHAYLDWKISMNKVMNQVMNQVKFDELNPNNLKPIVSFVLLFNCHDIEDTLRKHLPVIQNYCL